MISSKKQVRHGRGVGIVKLIEAILIACVDRGSRHNKTPIHTAQLDPRVGVLLRSILEIDGERLAEQSSGWQASRFSYV